MAPVKARVLELNCSQVRAVELTRAAALALRERFPKPALFRSGRPAPVLMAAFDDGLELLYLAPNQNLNAWLRGRFEVRPRERCALILGDGPRVRPERIALVLIPVLGVVLSALTYLMRETPNPPPPFFPLLALIPGSVVFGILSYEIRRQEKILLKTLAEFLPIAD
jgi:hypothetical protein